MSAKILNPYATGHLPVPGSCNRMAPILSTVDANSRVYGFETFGNNAGALIMLSFKYLIAFVSVSDHFHGASFFNSQYNGAAFDA